MADHVLAFDTHTGITPAGLVGIATTTPDSTLTVNGSADKPGGGSWSVFYTVDWPRIFVEFLDSRYR